VLIAGDAPLERLYPAYALGSRLIGIEAGIDDVIEALRRLSGHDGIYVASTTRASNPVQAEAAKTIAYEIVADLGETPDWVVVPTGGGGTIAGIWHGFNELLEAGIVDRTPRLVAVVPSGYDALREAFAKGIRDSEAYFTLPFRDDVPTILTKLAHAHPPDGLEALDAIRGSDGCVLAFGSDAAIDAVYRISSVDGLYMEPSSAVALLAVESLARDGQIRPGDTVVALACGSGFRETFVMQSARPLRIDHARLTNLDAAIRRSLIVRTIESSNVERQ
jgi:threonine synthase